MQGVWRMMALGLASAAAGCGTSPDLASGPASPELATEEFLGLLGRPHVFDNSALGRSRAKAFWRQLCAVVDPAIRPALKLEGQSATAEACGAVAEFAAMYTGDTGRMLPPSTIQGDVLKVATHGDRAVTAVEVRYRVRRVVAGKQLTPQAGNTPRPPRRARIQILAVRRDGAWWIAVPRAFNPLLAEEGGMTTDAQSHEHARLVRAARTSP